MEFNDFGNRLSGLEDAVAVLNWKVEDLTCRLAYAGAQQQLNNLERR
jgi:hypothetical protein